MAMWNVKGVDGEPEIVLVRWRILETDSGDRAPRWRPRGRLHRAGEHCDNEVRPLAHDGDDPVGRTYQLRGAPGITRMRSMSGSGGARERRPDIRDVTAAVYEEPKSIG